MNWTVSHQYLVITLIEENKKQKNEIICEKREKNEIKLTHTYTQWKIYICKKMKTL